MINLRSEKLEILDQPQISKQQINDSLGFMVLVNRYLGGTQVIMDYFNRHSIPDNFSVADLGSGSGDISYAIVQWARKNGKKVHIKALDINNDCLEYANEKFNAPEIEYCNYSAFKFNELGKFDYVISSMFFHHLNDEKIIELLKLIRLHCQRGFIINDLFRSVWSSIGVFILALFSFKYTVIHDATLSVLRGFKTHDLWNYCQSANIVNAHISRKPIYRIELSYHA